MGPLQTLLDSLAAEVPIYDGALGVDGTVPGTISYGAAANLATLRAIADSDVQADLVPTFRSRATAVKSPNLYRALMGPAVMRVLDNHYAIFGSGSLNQQLATFGLRVHPNLRLIGFVLDAPNVFVTPAIDPVATFAVTGAGVGNFVNVASIDESQYAADALQLVTTSVIGPAQINVTLTLRDANGAASQQVVAIPALTANTTAIAIPGRHYGVTNITITGGTAGDSFKVTAPVERAVAL